MMQRFVQRYWKWLIPVVVAVASLVVGLAGVGNDLWTTAINRKVEASQLPRVEEAGPLTYDVSATATERKEVDESQKAQERNDDQRLRVETLRLAYEIDRRNQEAYRWQVEQYQRQQQELRRKAEEIPELRCIGSRWENGYAVLSVAHPSPNRFANVSQVTYTITDAALLSKIRRVYPQPPDKGFGAANHVDDVFFKRGSWIGGTYQFTTNVGLNVPPGPATDLRLAILDPRLSGIQFVGELAISYDAGGQATHHLTLPTVRISARTD